MSHLLRRTKKSCLKLLRKISTSKQLFVQHLDEEDEDETQEMPSDAVDPQLDVNSNCQVTEAIYEELQLHESGKIEEEDRCLELASEAEEESKQESKLDLRLRYLMSQGNYESLATEAALDVEFERVPYKANVRYLRHTPSNSSLDLRLDEQQQQQLQQQQQQQQAVRQQLVPQPHQPIQQPQKIPVPSRFQPCSFSLGSKLEGNYHSLVIVEPPHDDLPIVRWDINGNSLDDDACDRWADFETRWKQAAAVTRSLSQSQRSSHQSSSCTLETWVDDAEPLSLELHHKHESVAAATNCNVCLRSF
ncbi:hypothetical protein KR018_011568 [Drosophila ironensis]|nr:hypothetical protein KR018_011568 [Drosophila ironensis]